MRRRQRRRRRLLLLLQDKQKFILGKAAAAIHDVSALSEKRSKVRADEHLGHHGHSARRGLGGCGGEGLPRDAAFAAPLAPYGRLSKAHVLDCLRDPGALNSRMYTFPENKLWFHYGLTHIIIICVLIWDLGPSNCCCFLGIKS